MRVRSAGHAALSDEKQVRKNFFRSFSFEMIFTFGRVAARHQNTITENSKTFCCLEKSMSACVHCQEDSAARTRAPDRCKTKSPLVSGPSSNSANLQKSGAGEGIRTLDPDLGKVVLYH
jgi:hypothetical protein